MGRDSNPRYGFPYSGFQDRRLRPLGHPSGFEERFLVGASTQHEERSRDYRQSKSTIEPSYGKLATLDRFTRAANSTMHPRASAAFGDDLAFGGGEFGQALVNGIG